MSTPAFARLHAELRECVEKQLHALPMASGVEGNTVEEEAFTKNLQEQIQLSEQVCIMSTSPHLQLCVYALHIICCRNQM